MKKILIFTNFYSSSKIYSDVNGRKKRLKSQMFK